MADDRMQRAIVLEARGLCRNFGGLTAVRDLSIRLLQGELHAVIGPNGAGKSTLVNLLSGELKPTSGSIRLLGRDVGGGPAWRMTRAGIGRSFQRSNIFPSLPVRENVRLAVQGVAVSASDAWRPASRRSDLIERAEQALARAGLQPRDNRLASSLSHGEQRQLEIAMTLASAPKVLLLDEPLAGMGPEESANVVQLLKGLTLDHAILLIEHDMDVVFAVADWMTVMVDGGVLAEGRPASIRASQAVRNAYLGGPA